MKPSPLTIHFSENISGSTTEVLWADLFQAISIEQRRAHRQGKVLAVGGIRFAANTAMNITTCALPTTWVLAEAWELAYDSWRELNRRALEETDETIVGPYTDFKVYADDFHMEAVKGATATNYAIFPLLATVAISNPDTSYEWDYSLLQFPEDTAYAGTPLNMFMLGPNSFASHNGLGIIHNYALSRARPSSPGHNVPGDDSGSLQIGHSAFTVMFDTGDNYKDIIDDLATMNDVPPYPLGMQESPSGTRTEEWYPGGSNNKPSMSMYALGMVGVSTAASGNIRGSGFQPGFLAPLGIVRFGVTNLSGSGGDLDIFVDLVPGHDNGILTQRMQEMNR